MSYHFVEEPSIWHQTFRIAHQASKHSGTQAPKLSNTQANVLFGRPHLQRSLLTQSHRQRLRKWWNRATDSMLLVYIIIAYTWIFDWLLCQAMSIIRNALLKSRSYSSGPVRKDAASTLNTQHSILPFFGPRCTLLRRDGLLESPLSWDEIFCPQNHLQLSITIRLILVVLTFAMPKDAGSVAPKGSYFGKEAGPHPRRTLWVHRSTA